MPLPRHRAVELQLRRIVQPPGLQAEDSIETSWDGGVVPVQLWRAAEGAKSWRRCCRVSAVRVQRRLRWKCRAFLIGAVADPLLDRLVQILGRRPIQCLAGQYSHRDVDRGIEIAGCVQQLWSASVRPSDFVRVRWRKGQARRDTEHNNGAAELSSDSVGCDRSYSVGGRVYIHRSSFSLGALFGRYLHAHSLWKCGSDFIVMHA